MKRRPFIGPVALRVVNFGIDTLLVNFKMAGPDLKPNGDALPEEAAALLDTWQLAARKEHKPVATPLAYHDKTLLIRPHGSGVWSWLLFNEDVKLSLSYGSMNGGVFCQARFLSHHLWSDGAEAVTVALQATLYDFTHHLTYVQASEIHLCADLQGWYDEHLSTWDESFVSRVVTMRARPDEPTEAEQAGGLSPKEIRKLEEEIRVQPIVTTTHRRLATLDFGSHGSDIMGQIYDKTKEIQKSKKHYFEPIWQANGWDGLSPIRRVEFRFRRKGLASFDLNDLYDVLAQVPLLWEYATQHWLRCVDLSSSSDTNKSRLPSHPVWLTVQGAHVAFAAACGDDVAACTTPEGEEAARLSLLLAEKPVQLLEQAVAAHAETVYEERPLLTGEEIAFTWSLVFASGAFTWSRLLLGFVLLTNLLTARYQSSIMQEYASVEQVVRDLSREFLPPDQVETLSLLQLPHADDQGVLLSTIQELAQEHLATLAPARLSRLVHDLSPEPFREVRSCLVKRSRRMAKKKACVAALAGHLTSLMALCVEEVATQPDLMASVVVAGGEIARYNASKNRVHLEEVWKKRLSYGFVTALELDEARRTQGVDLCEEDWAQLRAELASIKNNTAIDVCLKTQVA